MFILLHLHSLKYISTLNNNFFKARCFGIVKLPWDQNSYGFWSWIQFCVLWQISSTDMLFYSDKWISKDLEVWFGKMLISLQTDAEFLQTTGARLTGMLWQLCFTLVVQHSCKSGCAGQLSGVYGCLYVARIARAHQWVLPSELLVYTKLGWISHEKRGPFWDYQHSLLPCITLALVSASCKTLCKSEQKENIMWEEIARLLFKCQRDSDLFWVLEEMWERDICQILGLPIWLLWTTFLFPLSQ